MSEGFYKVSGFPRLGVPFGGGVPLKRVIVFEGPYWGPTAHYNIVSVSHFEGPELANTL